MRFIYIFHIYRFLWICLVHKRVLRKLVYGKFENLLKRNAVNFFELGEKKGEIKLLQIYTMDSDIFLKTLTLNIEIKIVISKWKSYYESFFVNVYFYKVDQTRIEIWRILW
jgi:hypothetical protein